MAERRFPIQAETRPIWRDGGREDMKMYTYPAFTIPWAVAEIAYAQYVAWFGGTQSLERLAERGGFGADELLMLLSGVYGREGVKQLVARVDGGPDGR